MMAGSCSLLFCASPATGQGRISAYRRTSVTPGCFAKNGYVDSTIQAYTHPMVRLGLWLRGPPCKTGWVLGPGQSQAAASPLVNQRLLSRVRRRGKYCLEPGEGQGDAGRRSK